jgi:hypothetical protein
VTVHSPLVGYSRPPSSLSQAAQTHLRHYQTLPPSQHWLPPSQHWLPPTAAASGSHGVNEVQKNNLGLNRNCSWCGNGTPNRRYYPALSGTECVSKLRAKPVGSFLIRSGTAYPHRLHLWFSGALARFKAAISSKGVGDSAIKQQPVYGR